MAPSTDQLSYYIYGKGSTATLLLLLVNVTLISAILACSFCKKSKEVDLLKNKSRKKRPNSELKKVIIHKENGSPETNGIKNGTIIIGTEVDPEKNKKENNKVASPRKVRGTVKNESDSKSPDIMHRVLPPPPEDLQTAPTALELDDPLYDSVKEMRDQLVEGEDALSNNNDRTAIDPMHDSSTLERVNPLYVSADEMEDPPSYQVTISELPSPEAPMKGEDSKAQVVAEPLYAVIRKEPSVKKQPAKTTENSPLQREVLVEELSETVVSTTSIEEKPPNNQSSSEKLDSMLNHWKKRGVISTQSPEEGRAVNVNQSDPPLVPVKLFDIESDLKQYTIEKETETDRDLPAAT
ncbi:uncharacterized protein [Dendropsophus ebraccatus]|uniref:uncharacterized protein n=1 Tax=Dendropsophus ebraccatus TaxID=150705 RepID=UPI00383111C1